MLLIVILVLAVPGNSQQPYPCSTNYTVRLDRNSSAGRLQICWSEEESPSTLKWYSVCSSTILNDVFAAADDVAALVCWQLGFNRTGYQGTFGEGTFGEDYIPCFNESFVFRS